MDLLFTAGWEIPQVTSP